MNELTLKNVGFAFGRRNLFEDLDLTFNQNGVTLILGRNGSGKSTLLRLMAGLLSPTSGSISIDGREFHNLAAADRARRIAWMGQEGKRFATWRVDDFVRTGRYPHRSVLSPPSAEDHLKSEEALGQLGLLTLRSRRLRELSGGEWQMARVARALAQDTPWLLLDEPFAPLDIGHRADLWKLLVLRDRPTVAVIHDLSFIGDGAKRVIVLGEHGVIADGATDEIVTRDTLSKAFGWSPPMDWKFQPFRS